MSYTKIGPFVDGTTPSVDALFLNDLEGFLVGVNSAATDSGVSADGSGNIAATSFKAGSGSGIYKIGGTMSAGVIMHFQDSTGYEPLRAFNGGIGVAVNNSSAPSLLQVGVALGVKKNNGAKLMEVNSSGNMLISGNTYYTTQSTFNFSAGGSFDSFDFAEIYRVDDTYPDGTVVCPADTHIPIPYQAGPGQRVIPLMTRCVHDGCPLAHIISREPGFCAGHPNYPDVDGYDWRAPLTMAIALVGRVFVRTGGGIVGRQYVCSDGNGGVRAVVPGESVMALGVALAPSQDGVVPLVLRAGLIGGAR
jgi:hypothetical protein